MADNPHNHRLNASQKPRLRLLRWVKKYGLTREEWSACKASADLVIAVREHKMQYVEGHKRMENCPPWDGPEPDAPLQHMDWRRQASLLQVVAEIVHHRGVSLSDYLYRARRVA